MFWCNGNHQTADSSSGVTIQLAFWYFIDKFQWKRGASGSKVAFTHHRYSWYILRGVDGLRVQRLLGHHDSKAITAKHKFNKFEYKYDEIWHKNVKLSTGLATVYKDYHTEPHYEYISIYE
ncbi:hypothetical protein CRE_07582 [Caenorhabditis remanei]|uniref:Uncharacterized protein n=1 Tax=Caenorhabditis remanei TaxID=31234 RepID=E3MP43_CAERE|nr:hypothetical protein CRE_07582 [Caenorhabditis remanei]